MTNAYSFEGILIVSLLVICTCSYMRRIPRLKQWFLSERKGFLGVFYKGKLCCLGVAYTGILMPVASVIGTRLHIPVAVACSLMAFYVMMFK